VLDDETKAQVDQEMSLEKNKVLEQELGAILADWRRYYSNRFRDDGLLCVNPPTPIEVDFPQNSAASPLFQSPKMRPVARMKSLLDPVVKTPKLVNWASPSTASLAFWISGSSSLVHQPPRDSGGQSFTHNA